MSQIPQCTHCLFYSHNSHLICAVHPYGIEGNSCIDFREDPNTEIEELWQPEGIRDIDNELVFEPSFYNGVEIIQPLPLTQQQQLEILNNHPLFTGYCPQCGAEFDRDYVARVHWDCVECGWKDDSI